VRPSIVSVAPTPAVLGAEPRTVSASVDSMVRLRGAGFAASLSHSCRLISALGTSIVTACAIISAERAECSVPAGAMPPGEASVTLLVHAEPGGPAAGVAVGSAAIVVVPAPSPAGAWPTLGPAAGGTIVTVEGASFWPGDGAVCRFTFADGAAVDIPAVVVDDTTITCSSPAATAHLRTGAIATLSVTNDGTYFVPVPGEVPADAAAAGFTFAFHHQVALSSVQPRVLQMGVPARITATVRDLALAAPFPELACLFDGVPVPAVVVVAAARADGAVEVQCRMPGLWPTSGTIAFAIALNGVDAACAPQHLSVVPAAAAAATVTPSVVAMTGGVSLVVDLAWPPELDAAWAGDEIWASGDWICVFEPGTPATSVGEPARVPASAVNRGAVSCPAAPAAMDGPAYLHVASHSAGMKSGVATIMYVDTPQPAQLAPALGPALGGTLIFVRGAGFTDSAAVACRVAGVAAAARWLDAFTMSCLVPPRPAHAAVTAGFPAVAVRVEVSNDGTTFHAGREPLTFVYHTDMAAITVQPAAGVATGGTLVTVNISFAADDSSNPAAPSSPPVGKAVALTAALDGISPACRFNGTATVPAFLGATADGAQMLRCLAPTAAAAGSVRLEVTLNGVDFSDAHSSFDYAEAPVVRAVWPVALLAGGSGGSVVLAITPAADPAQLALTCVVLLSPAPGDGSQSPMRATGALARHNATAVSCMLPGLPIGEHAITLASHGMLLAPAGSARLWAVGAVPLALLTPTAGPATGGQSIQLHAYGSLPPVQWLQCEWARGARTPAVAISEQAVRCEVPARAAGHNGTAAVAVHLAVAGGERLSPDPLAYTYYAAPVAQSVSPSVSPIGGGVVVTVLLTGADADSMFPAAACRFGSAEVPAATDASAVGQLTLQCVSPALDAAGPVRFSATLNGLDEYAMRTFTYVPAPVLLAAEPRMLLAGAAAEVTLHVDVPTQVGGTAGDGGGSEWLCAISAAGNSLLSWAVATQASAVGGLITVPARPLAPDVFACTLPAAAAASDPQRALFQLLWHGTRVPVRGDELDGEAVGLELLVLSPPEAAAASPSSAIDGATTYISVTGGGFGVAPGAALACVAVASAGRPRGTIAQAVPATRVSATVVTCTMGPLQPGEYGIAITYFDARRVRAGNVTAMPATTLPTTALVSADGASLLVAAAAFTVLPPAALHDSLPSVLPAQGGVTLLLRGSGIRDHAALACVFAAGTPAAEFARSPAVFVNATAVVCAAAGLGGAASVAAAVITPGSELRAWRAIVYVVAGQRQEGAVGAAITYVELPTIVAVRPAGACVTQAGLPVTVTVLLSAAAGPLFELAAGSTEPLRPLCRAGTSSPLLGSWLNATAAACPVPALAPGANTGGGAVTVALELSLDGGRAFTDSGQRFTYLPVPHAWRLRPQRATAMLAPPQGAASSDSAVDGVVAAENTAAGMPPSIPVTVHGSGFVHTPALSCTLRAAFTAAGGTPRPAEGAVLARTAAWYVSSTVVVCVLPAALGYSGAATLRVSNDGKDGEDGGAVGVSASEALAFTLDPPVTLLAVQPESGSMLGGQLVTLTGTNFRSVEGLSCSFDAGATWAPAVYVSPNQLQCVTPAVRAAGRVEVRVSNGGGDSLGEAEARALGAVSVAAEAGGVPFTFTPDVAVLGVLPAVGSLHGGTRVTLYGLGLADAAAQLESGSGSKLLCAFVLHDSGEHQQPTPAALLNGAAAAAAGVPDGYDAVTCATAAAGRVVSARAELAIGAAGAAAASIITAHGPTYAFDYPPEVADAEPTVGFEAGGMPLRVRGSGFGAGSATALACVFEAAASNTTARTLASASGDTQLWCAQPPLQPGIYTVRVTANGVDISSSAAMLRVLVAMQATMALPSVISAARTSGGSASFLLLGTNFVPHPALTCILTTRDARVALPAAVHSANAATCVLEGISHVQLPAGSYRVQLGWHGTDADGGAAAEAAAATTPDDSAGPVVQVLDALSGTAGISVSPAAGPVTGGTTVKLHGLTLPAGSGGDVNLFCVFGGPDGARVPLAWVERPGSETEHATATCVTPQAEAASSVPLYVLAAGVLLPTDAEFAYQPAAIALVVVPALVPAAGGALLRVTGRGFVNSGLLSCRVGTAEVPARWVSAWEVHCVAQPASALGAAAVAVANNGVDFDLSGGATVEYVPQPTLLALVPAAGSAAGGTMLQLTATGVARLAGQGIRCRFGGVVDSVAEAVGDNLVRCTSPSAADVLLRDASLLSQPGLRHTVTVTVVAADGASGSPLVEAGLAFTYVGPPRVASAAPLLGPAAGGSALLVRAAGLSANQSQCRFGGRGGIAVEASIGAPIVRTGVGVMTCRVPSQADVLAAGGTVSADGTTPVAVSNTGGADWLALPTGAFAYTEPLALGSITPSVLAAEAEGPRTVTVACAGAGPSTSATCRLARVGGASPGSGAAAAAQLRAFAVTNDTVVCTVPTLPPGRYALTVALNDVDFEPVDGTAPVLSLLPQPTVLRATRRLLAPHVRPTELGAGPVFTSQLEIRGANFPLATAQLALACVFDGGSQVSAGSVVTDTRALCAWPTAAGGLPLPEPSTLQLRWRGSAGLRTQTVQLTQLHEGSSLVLPGALPSLSPTGGPATGGTVVTIVNVSWPTQTEEGTRTGAAVVQCIFGAHAPTPALSADEYTGVVVCTAPAAEAVLPVAVATLHAGGTPCYASGHFSYQPLPFAARAEPDSVTEAGGAIIRVRGDGFINNLALACRFALSLPTEIVTNIVPAMWLSTTEVRCTSTRLPPGDATLAVANNGVDFSPATARVRVLPLVSLYSLMPAAGPTTGGTRVRIRGTNIRFTPALCCRFGNVTVPAGVIEAAAVCIAPAWDGTASSSGEYSPDAAVASVNVTVSEDCSYWAEPGLPFTYQRVPLVTSMRPVSGPFSGGTAVALNGTGLRSAGESTLCRFGGGAGSLLSVAVPSASDAAMVVCASPAVRRSSRLSRTGTSTAPAAMFVPLWLSANGGADWHATGLEFRYEPQLVVTRAQPASGPEIGGFRLTVSGSGFAASSLLTCRFTIELAKVVGEAVNATLPAPCLLDAGGSVSGAAAVAGSLFALTDTTGAALRGHATLPSSSHSCTITSAADRNVTLVQRTVPARWLSDGLLVCTAPPMPRGEVGLEVSNNAVDFVAGTRADGSPVRVAFHGSVQLTKVEPVVVHPAGGTLIRLRGTGFVATESLRCRFGAPRDAAAPGTGLPHVSAGVAASRDGTGVQDVPAGMLDATTVQCTVPPATAIGITDTLAVTVVASGEDGVSALSHNYLNLTLLPPPVVAGLAPRVSLLAGGLVVTVAGEHLTAPVSVAAPPTRCRFTPAAALAGVRGARGARTAQQWGTVVLARVANASTITCVVPAAGSPGSYFLQVSVNGQDYSQAVPLASFTYAPPPSVAAVSPWLGPASGGSVVTVTGWDFLDSPQLACRFGTLPPVPATFLNVTAVACTAPAADPELDPTSTFGGTQSTSIGSGVAVEVTFAGQDYTADGVRFAYHAPARVFYVEPAAGPASGAGVVTVHGFGFQATGGLACRFGERSVPASFLSAQAVACRPPAQPVATVHVAVSLNGADFAGSGAAAQQNVTVAPATYTYFAPAAVTGLIPASGPTFGGTRVVLRGGPFFVPLQPGQLRCRFGAMVVPAVLLNATAVTCAAPAAEGGRAGSVTLGVAMNGADFASDPARQFVYQEPHTILAVLPPLLEEGSDDVMLRVAGRAFTQTAGLLCRFSLRGGSAQEAAAAPEAALAPAMTDGATTTALTCTLPAAMRRHGLLLVQVAVNGQDFLPREPREATGSSGGGSIDAAATAAAQIAVVAPLQVVQLYPAAGPLSGGTRVSMVTSLSLQPPPAGMRLTCRFNDAVDAPARVLAPHLIECAAPRAVSVGAVPLAVSLNGLQFTTVTWPFVYTAPHVVDRVAPAMVPEGRTAGIVVIGTGFYEAASEVPAERAGLLPAEVVAGAACRFTREGAPAGSAPLTLAARVMNSTHTMCDDFPVGALAAVAAVAAKGGSTPAVLTVAVSMDGQHFSLFGRPLRVHAPVLLVGLYPPAASERGGRASRCAARASSTRPGWPASGKTRSPARWPSTPPPSSCPVCRWPASHHKLSRSGWRCPCR
jgi:uncharacterized protein (DUF2141 family)